MHICPRVCIHTQHTHSRDIYVQIWIDIFRKRRTHMSLHTCECARDCGCTNTQIYAFEYVHVCVCVRAHVYMHADLDIALCVFVCLRSFACICVCVSICMTHINVHTCTYSYIYTCTWQCTYILHIHTDGHTYAHAYTHTCTHIVQQQRTQDSGDGHCGVTPSLSTTTCRAKPVHFSTQPVDFAFKKFLAGLEERTFWANIQILLLFSTPKENSYRQTMMQRAKRLAVPAAILLSVAIR